MWNWDINFWNDTNAVSGCASQRPCHALDPWLSPNCGTLENQSQRERGRGREKRRAQLRLKFNALHPRCILRLPALPCDPKRPLKKRKKNHHAYHIEPDCPVVPPPLPLLFCSISELNSIVLTAFYWPICKHLARRRLNKTQPCSGRTHIPYTKDHIPYTHIPYTICRHWRNNNLWPRHEAVARMFMFTLG